MFACFEILILRKFKCKKKSTRCTCFHHRDPFLAETDKQVWFSAARATAAFVQAHYRCLTEVLLILGNSITAQRRQSCSQRELVRVCTVNVVCSNRLNKLVIGTPTAVCGSQKEKKSVIMERWKDLFFSKCCCCLLCFLNFFLFFSFKAENIQVLQ